MRPDRSSAKDVVGNHDAALFSPATFGVPGIAGTTAFKVAAQGAVLRVSNAIEFTGEAPFALEGRAIRPTPKSSRTVSESGSCEQRLRALFQEHRHRLARRGLGRSARGGATDVDKADTFVRRGDVRWDNAELLRQWRRGAQHVASDRRSRAVDESDDHRRVVAGVLDELAVYDHALPPERATAHYRIGRGR